MRILFLTLAIFSFTFFAPSLTHAQASPNPTTSANESVGENHGPYSFADGTVNLEDEVYAGSVFVAGGEVAVYGDVQGDLVVAGGTIRILGNVEQDIYAAGGSITIAGTVGGNVVAAGGEVHLTDTAEVSDSTVLAAENLTLAGTVLNKAITGAGTVTMRGKIMNDVQVGVEKLILESGSFIGGDLTGQIGEEPQVATDSQVIGQTNLERLPEQEPEDHTSQWVGRIVTTIWFWGSQTVFAWLLFYVWPQLLTHKANIIASDWLQSMLRGIALMVLGPVVIVVLLATVLFLPLAGMGFVFYICLLFLAHFLVYLPIGQKLLPKESGYLQIAIGSGVMSFLGLLPIVGWVIRLIAMAIGLGAILHPRQTK